MRIAITGTHGTGKTTLLKELREIEPYKSSYTFVTELTRKLHEKGYPINEQGTDETQRILAEQCAEASLIDNSIADRCVLDNIVFTTFLYGENKVNTDTMKDAIEKFEANISNFDIIFYVRPEFELVDDGVRTTSLDTRDKIYKLFEYYIDKYKIPVVILSGSVEERIKRILDEIKERENSCYRVVVVEKGVKVHYDRYFGCMKEYATQVFSNLSNCTDIPGFGNVILIEGKNPGDLATKFAEIEKQYNIK